ncbi:MAG: ribokinase [Ilumatobacteraceae bacterium]
MIGSANLDLVATTSRLPAPGETVLGRDFAEHAGGKGLNQAVAAARAGARTAFVSAVGGDNAGAVLLDVMHHDGIDTTFVPRRDGVPTGRALIGVADDGENSIIVVPGANATVAVEALPPCRVALAQLEVPLDAITSAFRLARDAGAITVLNPAPAQPLDRSLLELCDVVVPNEHEAELLGGAAALLDLGARAIVTTRGADGARLTTRAGTVPIAPFRVDARDTTAAGDTFCGALCARLAAGEPIEEALRFASAAAAISTTRAGAVPSVPVIGEVLALLDASTFSDEA